MQRQPDDPSPPPPIEVAAHFRFVDLHDPIPIGDAEAAWLDDVRRALGIQPLSPVELFLWKPAQEADPAAVVDALRGRQTHTAIASVEFTKLKHNLRRYPWCDNPKRVRLETVTVGGQPIGLIVRLARDGKTVEQARSAVVALANEARLWTYDATARQLYRENEQPVALWTGQDVHPSSPLEVRELRFDVDLLGELARLRAGPLMVWPLPPSVDEEGVREDYRADDEALPHALWALPANQELLLGLKLGYFFSNDGIIAPLVDDLAPLRELERRRVTKTGAMTRVEPFDRTPGWPEVVEHLGWAYLPNGPDTLWGDLHVAQRNLPLLQQLREWCRRTGRTWARYERRGGEIVRVLEPPPAPPSQPA
jgi:hypothetical protein